MATAGATSDFDGFVSPLFVQVPMARLNLANAVRHVVSDGAPADKLRWDGIWTEELASQGPILGLSFEVDSAQPNEGYYKFNLHHLAAFNLLRTTSGAERDLFARSFAVMDTTTRDDVNAHFEAIAFSITGEQARLDDAITHLQQWRDYRRTTTGTGASITNSTRCGTEITCVPGDQYDVQSGDTTVTWFPGQPSAPPVSSAKGPRAARPLPVAQRVPSDFLWQRPPTQLDGGQPATLREPGADFLTPYWMLRYLTEVAPPALRPLPAWVGPAHA
jgi:hypothetical protein